MSVKPQSNIDTGKRLTTGNTHNLTGSLSKDRVGQGASAEPEKNKHEVTENLTVRLTAAGVGVRM